MLGITLAREAFHLLHHQGMRQPKIEHAGQMGELKPLPPIGDFPTQNCGVPIIAWVSK